MLVRIARAKVGHRQAPQMKRPIPQGVGLFIWRPRWVTYLRHDNTPASRALTEGLFPATSKVLSMRSCGLVAADTYLHSRLVAAKVGHRPIRLCSAWCPLSQACRPHRPRL